MKSLHLTWMSVIVALAGLAGCATRGGLGALQTELRHREDQISQLDRDLEQARKELDIAKRERESLRTQLSRNVSTQLLPEQSDLIFRAEGLKFSEYLTSGVDRDGQPGDELVSVLLTPHDAAGDPLRLPGQLKVEIRDLNNPDGQQLIGRWTWDEQKVIEQWHNGFMSSGYHLELPLTELPPHEEVTLHAQLTTPDGRQFSATQPIQLRLPDGSENIAATKSRRTPEIRKASNLERSSMKRNVERPITPDLKESPLQDDLELNRTADQSEKRETRSSPEGESMNPFDDQTDELRPAEATRPAKAKEPAPKRGDRRTETSDRYRSFDPPRYQ